MEMVLQYVRDNAQWFLLGAGILIALIPFGFGIAKGFRKLHWGCWIWGVTAVAFYFLYNLLYGLEAVQNVLAGLPIEEAVKPFVFAIVLAVALVLAVLLIVGIFAFFVRPGKPRELTDFEKEMVEEKKKVQWLDLDEDEILKKRSQEGKPCFFNRLVGGIFNLLNFVVVVVGILAVALVIINVTPLREGALSVVYENEVFATVWQYVFTYVWDFLIIGFFVAMAYAGYKSGVACGLYSVLSFFGYLALIVFAFYLPFSPLILDKLTFLADFACWIADTLFIPMGLAENLAIIVGQVCVGVVLAVLFCIVWALLMLGYKAVVNVSLRKEFWCFIDGIFGVVIRLLIAVIITALVLTLLYVLHYYAVLDLTAFVSQDSPIVGGAFKTLETYLVPLLEQIAGAAGL